MIPVGISQPTHPIGRPFLTNPRDRQVFRVTAIRGCGRRPTTNREICSRRSLLVSDVLWLRLREATDRELA